ncbi:MAG: YeeE/YedE family protein, partial [Comamonadaceae bacterium]
MSLPADPASLSRLVVFGALAIGLVLDPVGDRLVWLSSLVGGLLFGAGMILAQGCPQRALVKAGSGNVKAAVTLLVIAVASAMTLRGLFATPRAEGLDRVSVALGGPQDFGTLIGGALGTSPQAIRYTLAWLALAGVVVLGWRLRRGVAKADWIGGIVVGLLVAAALYLTGHIGFLPEHPETLEPAWLGTQSRRPEGLSFAAPMAHALDLLTLWTDKSMVATFGVMLALG